MLSSVRLWIRSITGNPMVKQRRVSAVLRAVRWQIAKRMGSKRALVTVGPAHFWCHPGNSAAGGALYTGFMEFDEMAFAVRFLRPDEHFVDVGANIGTFSLYAASFVPGVRVTSVEPDDAARERLLENLRLNDLPVDRVVGKALAAQPGVARFSTGRDTLNALSDEEDSVEVEVTTLDRLVGADRPALVKIDVEGAELGVFEGAVELLASDPAPTLIFEMNGYCRKFGVEPDQIYSFLTTRGFSLFEYAGDANELVVFNGIGLPRSHNLVATKDIDGARARLGEQWSTDELRSVPIHAKLRGV